MKTVTLIHSLNEIISMQGVHQKDGRHLLPEDLSILKNAAIIFNEDEILWVGQNSDLAPAIEKTFAVNKKINGDGHVLLPELVDAHTHLVFAGDRADEYVQRLNGKSYEKIAEQGGGIVKTMQSTCLATKEILLESANSRIEQFYQMGIGSIEIKSGYAGTFAGEYLLSQIISELKKSWAPKVHIHRTFMPAHAIVPGKTADEMMQEIVFPLLKKVTIEKLIDSVDIFHEIGYFSGNHVVDLFDRCQTLGIPIRIHADEFNDNGGAELAIKYNALSADHLMQTNNQAIQKLSTVKTVAVLLPGTSFFLGKKEAPARHFLDAGVKLAIASDFNPGSCHWGDLWSIAMMAAPRYKMNIAETIASITYNAAAALDLENQGVIAPKFKSRLLLVRGTSINHLVYDWGKKIHRENHF